MFFNHSLYNDYHYYIGEYLISSKPYLIRVILNSTLIQARQYLDAFALLVSAKRRYDPDNLLTPSPGILEASAPKQETIT
ncbi:hypothetical protein [Nostoc sp. UIC 10630]|uniref:hypothetical protein n=1 Tax=Nostoc sp. UIC 10630 TaxID=2100146 RepID=UPI0013D4AB02|nr:hypothetical protein [Nostoc sp. UIC 10630]NEU79771.1 hypothetical protein [Nostoc sp. UIC 10630]